MKTTVKLNNITTTLLLANNDPDLTFKQELLCGGYAAQYHKLYLILSL